MEAKTYMTIDTILFDMDGVLADSELLWNDIDAALLAEHDIVYAGEHKHQVIGKSFSLSLQFYKEHYGLKPEIEELSRRRHLIASDYYANRIERFEDALETLQTLQSQKLRIGLATSTLNSLALAFLDRHNLRDFFEAITTGEEVEHGKPYPDIYLKAAQKLDASPSRCLVVEDSLAGVQSGKSAGMTVAAIPDARFADALDYKDKADFILERLGEVPNIIRVLNEAVI